MRHLILILLFFFHQYISSSKTPTDIILSYSPINTFGFISKTNIDNTFNMGCTIIKNNYIVGVQWIKIGDTDIYGLNLGAVIFEDSLSMKLCDQYLVYTSAGFYDTSRSSEYFTDTNYPDIIISILFRKNNLIYGIGYSYFSNIKLQIGFKF